MMGFGLVALAVIAVLCAVLVLVAGQRDRLIGENHRLREELCAAKNALTEAEFKLGRALEALEDDRRARRVRAGTGWKSLDGSGPLGKGGATKRADSEVNSEAGMSETEDWS